ncbi:far upstream element-binding protein [Microdochium nivale]|nr:far upstream element-binding protein [Microdochium nivale]
MAEPPRSIESILAALAAQRPPTASTPTQGQPPHAAPSYNPAPGAYPPAAPHGSAPPQYGGGAYGLPQPSSSGTFDMSAIKPTSSGAVNIADAIAQAKAYAADKGITPYQAPPGGYPAHNPHGDARQFRSRSRSPNSRRDAYNDNYNPYRDERRGDDRGGRPRDFSGRERSRSPGARGGFSPRGGGRAGGGGGGGSGGGDDDTDTIQIESSLVGLIIGRQGENLRRVESSTGCRVQFVPPTDKSAPFRQCKISGPRAARTDAAAQINRIVEDSGMGALARSGMNQAVGRGGPPAPGPEAPVPQEGEDCMQIMVPDRTVGLIIGRGGETIRDLQERSGCHINIVAENKSVNGLRPVNLIGSHEATTQAKELILEIVESDSRNDGGPKGGRPPRTEPGREQQGGYGGGGFGGGSGGGGGGGDKINDRIFVPSDAVGMIIGKGGETIREMQNSTGCKINVSQSSGPGEVEREIGLVGSRDSIQRAKQAIEDKVDTVKNNGGGPRGARPSGGGGGRREYDNANYAPQNAGGQPATAPAGAAAPAGGEDPYAPYGGYQAYLALWYQSIAAQQSQGGAKPPGA